MNDKRLPLTNVYSRRLLPVIISSGAVGLSIGLIVPLTSVVLEQRGISVIANGLNATVYSLAVLLIGPFLPACIHRLGSLRTMVAGTLLSGVFVFCLWLNDALWFWYLMRFFLGIAGGMHWVSSEAWINAMAPGHSRGRIVGAYATVWTMGLATGPVLLRFIGVEGARPFVIAALVMAGATLPLLLVPKVENGHLPAVRHGVLQMIWVAPVATTAGFISGFLETEVLSLLPIYGLRSEIETAYALTLVSVFSVGSFACQPFIGWIADRAPFKTVGLAVSIVSVVIVPLVHVSLDLVLLSSVLLFIWGGAVGAFYTLGMLNIGQVFKATDLTAASSMFVMAYTFGMVVGPISGSSSMQVFGPVGLLAVMGTAPLLFLPLLLRRSGDEAVK
ncbi:MAG: MFS transporter [Deltaproteobacteria bacterium]|nr:MFS transporter [Deltaproteobacteria bacterium]